MPSEDEHVGYAPGKNPPTDFFKFGTHKYGRDVITYANFGSISFSGFGNTAFQSYSLPIDNAHFRAYNSVPTTVGTCDMKIKIFFKVKERH